MPNTEKEMKKEPKVKIVEDQMANEAKRKINTEDMRAESQEYLKKGMDRLSGSKKMVQSSIMIKTEDGWKPILIERRKITY